MLVPISFLDLSSADSPNIQNDQRRIEHIESLRGVLQDILTVDLLPDESDFVAIYGRVCC